MLSVSPLTERDSDPGGALRDRRPFATIWPRSCHLLSGGDSRSRLIHEPASTNIFVLAYRRPTWSVSRRARPRHFGRRLRSRAKRSSASSVPVAPAARRRLATMTENSKRACRLFRRGIARADHPVLIRNGRHANGRDDDRRDGPRANHGDLQRPRKPARGAHAAICRVFDGRQRKPVTDAWRRG